MLLAEYQWNFLLNFCFVKVEIRLVSVKNEYVRDFCPNYFFLIVLFIMRQQDIHYCQPKFNCQWSIYKRVADLVILCLVNTVLAYNLSVDK